MTLRCTYSQLKDVMMTPWVLPVLLCLIITDSVISQLKEDDRCTNKTVSFGDIHGAVCDYPPWVPRVWIPDNCDRVDASEFPSREESVQVLKRTLEYLQWSSCTLIYDHSTAGLLHDLTTMNRLSHFMLYHTLVNVTSLRPRELRQRLTNFYMSWPAPHNYVLICSQTCITTVIKVANSVDTFSNRYTYMRHHSRWLVLGSRDTLTSLLDVGNSLDNLAVLSVPVCRSEKRHDSNNNDTLQARKRDTCVEVSTLLWSSKGRVWSTVCHMDTDGDFPIHGTVFPNTHYGYNQRKFIVTTKTWLGFSFKTTVNGTTEYGGFCIEVLNELATILNFTYRLMEPPDNEWGSVVDGKWIGIVGQLKRREIDLAMASLSRNSARDAVIDFVATPFFRDYKDVMYRKLHTTKDWRLLLDIFRPTVLLCIGVALAGITVLYLLVQLGPNERRQGHTCLNVSNVGFYVFGALFSQGGERLPSSASGRFLVASWWIFSIVMSATYSAKLIANLAVPQAEKPFSSLEELFDSTDYKWGVVGRGSTFYLLSTSTDSKIKRLWGGMVEFNKTDPTVFGGSNEGHIQKVMAEKYAYIMGHDKLGNNLDCQVTYLREKLFEYSKGMAVPQDSPLKDDFDREMLHLSETGFLNKLSKKWLISDSQCVTRRSSATVVTLEDMQSAFYLLLAGIGGSCAALIAELICRLLRQRRSKALKIK